jgi:hypothetical protein
MMKARTQVEGGGGQSTEENSRMDLRDKKRMKIIT